MKIIKGLVSLVICMAILLAVAFSVSAIGFSAEEAYNSIFVIYSGNALGSGFAISENKIITNAHVIDNPSSVKIRTFDGKEYPATVLGMDTKQDIAVLGVESVKFPALETADYTGMAIGSDVYAIGAPKSMSYTLTKGIISAKEREIEGYTYIQIDAAVNEGNSGGPLLDDSGKVIGVITLKLTDSEGIGLAIPISRVTDFMDSLNNNVTSDGNGTEDGNNSEGSSIFPSFGADDGNRPHYLPKGVSPYLIIGCGVAFLLLSGGIVLAIVLVKAKKRTVTVPFDPRDRTDFEIDILE